MSKRENTDTLYLYVKEYIMKLLVSDKYPPNSKLPTEFELMHILHVGRATVREALARLENEGFIYKKQGIGTFVAENDDFSIHPFASFSYTAHSLGFNDTISPVEENDFEVSDKDIDLLKNWESGTKGKYAKRIRLIEGAPVAIDSVYLLEIAYNLLGEDYAFKESINEKLNLSIQANINHIATDVFKRKPSSEEVSQLHVSNDEDVVEIKRWMFADSMSPVPVAYTNIVISSRLFKLQKDYRVTKK